VRISVAFTGNDPDAPLTLETRPAGAPPQDDGGFHAGGLPPVSPPPSRSTGGRP
jgi:hypothetical protein